MIIVDDSKSRNRLSDRFLAHILSSCDLKKYKIISRNQEEDDFYPNKDNLNINYSDIIKDFIY